MVTAQRSNIARRPATKIPGLPVVTVCGPIEAFGVNPYTGAQDRATVWRVNTEVQAGMADGVQVVVCCPECGQLQPWQSEHLLVVCGWCGSESAMPKPRW